MRLVKSSVLLKAYNLNTVSIFAQNLKYNVKCIVHYKAIEFKGYKSVIKK